MKGERLMPKVYDRRDRYVGYVDGNSIYDRKHRLIGFVQDNMVYDSNYNPVSFFYNDSFYWMNGTPWGYFDGRTVRDLEGRKLGRVRNAWPAVLSAALLLGRNFETSQHEYVTPVPAGRHNRGYISSSNYSQNPTPTQQYGQQQYMPQQFVPQTNSQGVPGNSGYGFGGIMQNIMGAGRNLLNGLGGFGRFNPAANMPMGNPGPVGMPVQNVTPGAVPGSGAAGNPGLGFGMQDLMNLGRVMLGNAGGAAAGAGGAAAGAGGAGALASAAGWLRPIGSVVGQYFLKNPDAALNLLSKFVVK